MFHKRSERILRNQTVDKVLVPVVTHWNAATLVIGNLCTFWIFESKIRRTSFVRCLKTDFNSHAGGMNSFFLVSSNFFAWILISKTGVMMNLRMIAKNYEADPEIGFLIKSISKSFDRKRAMSPVRELNKKFQSHLRSIQQKVRIWQIETKLSSQRQIATVSNI